MARRFWVARRTLNGQASIVWLIDRLVVRRAWSSHGKAVKKSTGHRVSRGLMGSQEGAKWAKGCRTFRTALGGWEGEVWSGGGRRVGRKPSNQASSFQEGSWMEFP